MRLELLRFRPDARAHDSRFDLIAQVKGGGAYGRKCEVDILETRFVHLADKAQGDVQVLRLDPARVGQAAAELGNAILNGFRERDGDKQADHVVIRPPPPGGRPNRAPSISTLSA